MTLPMDWLPLPNSPLLQLLFLPHMPPPRPPLSSPSAAAAVAVVVFVITFPISAATDTCKPPPDSNSSSSSASCPPFPAAAPSYPFGSSPGCGHPSFQLSCSSPHSLISINNLSFAVLSSDPNSSSLVVSPHPNGSNPHPQFPSVPTRPIDFSSSPFRISHATCLSLLHDPKFISSSAPRSLQSCSSWLLPGCRSGRPNPPLPGNKTGCRRGDDDGVLEFLDKFLSRGIRIEWDTGDPYFFNCTDCRAKHGGGVCGFNSSDPKKAFVCFSITSIPPSPPWIRRRSSPKASTLLESPAAVGAIVACCGVLVVSVAVIVIARSRRLLRSFLGATGVAAGDKLDQEDPTMVFLRRHRPANLLPPVFTYDELEGATKKFDPSRKIGDGGFGSVYLGQLPDGGGGGGRLVAVKHLHRQRASGPGRAFATKSFCNEILILSSIDHPNLVKLHGYCSDPRGLLLVYDYVPNGTLADHLHGPKNNNNHNKNRKLLGVAMAWRDRVEIALQTAMALEYLHFGVEPAVVHRDITSSNIFIDEEMRVKLGDFGLSRLLVFPETTSSSSSPSSAAMQCVWTGPQGTPGYLDPDYHRSFRLTEKSDVYSFGVVLLELISGMKAVDGRREMREAALADLVVPKIQTGLLRQVVDPLLLLPPLEREGEAMDGVAAVAELAFRCLAAEKDDRPDAREVVAELRRISSRARGCAGDESAADRASSVPA